MEPEACQPNTLPQAFGGLFVEARATRSDFLSFIHSFQPLPRCIFMLDFASVATALDLGFLFSFLFPFCPVEGSIGY